MRHMRLPALGSPALCMLILCNLSLGCTGDNAQEGGNERSWVEVAEPDLPDGLVPDAKTAAAIAEAVWRALYGDQIDQQRPFIAERRDSLWFVSGSINMRGGVAYAVIAVRDGRILEVRHGQ